MTDAASSSSTHGMRPRAETPPESEPRRPPPATPRPGTGNRGEEDPDEGVPPPIDQDMDLPGMEPEDDEQGHISPHPPRA